MVSSMCNCILEEYGPGPDHLPGGQELVDTKKWWTRTDDTRGRGICGSRNPTSSSMAGIAHDRSHAGSTVVDGLHVCNPIAAC